MSDVVTLAHGLNLSRSFRPGQPYSQQTFYADSSKFGIARSRRGLVIKMPPNAILCLSMTIPFLSFELFSMPRRSPGYDTIPLNDVELKVPEQLSKSTEDNNLAARQQNDLQLRAIRGSSSSGLERHSLKRCAETKELTASTMVLPVEIPVRF